MPEPTPHRCPMPTTEEPAPSACCLMLVLTSSRIVIAAMPPVASNLQITTNDCPAVNPGARIRSWRNSRTARPRLAGALARVGDRWTLMVEALVLTPNSDAPPARRGRVCLLAGKHGVDGDRVVHRRAHPVPREAEVRPVDLDLAIQRHLAVGA